MEVVTIKNWFKEAINGFLEFVYPIGCRGCGVFGFGYLCSECRSNLVFITDPKCKHCSIPIDSEKRSFCRRCTVSFGYHDGGISIALYQDPLGKLIRELKYDRQTGIADFLAEIAVSRIDKGKTLASLRCDYIHPVPLSRKRFRMRGFNQSALIAAKLAKSFGMEYRDDILVRIRDTETQIGMGLDERAMNIIGAFEVPDIDRVEDKSILLVDDVMTTGATIEECARALKIAGAGKVKFLTIARDMLDYTSE
jgi:competence protein ComFC